jgi:hypothetical protein
VRRLAAAVLLLLPACAKQPASAPLPPVAEFLLSAGDSTYWVRSGPEGVRVRSAPILLTRADGRFYEIFVTDDARDYDDASFATARAYRRDIAGRDSLLIFADSSVDRETRAWIRAHPRALPLEPDDVHDDTPPPTLVTDDIEVVDVHGPWLTYSFALDVDVAGRPTPVHRRRRGVIDIRNGTPASLTILFGADDGTRAQHAAQLAFGALRDSILLSTDSRSSKARHTLGSFKFDSMSFALTDHDLLPAVAYAVAGTGDDGEALSLYLPVQPVAAPAWWSRVAATLPRWTTDSTTMQWSKPAYDVVARPAMNGDVVFVSLDDRPATGKAHSWPIAAVPSPAYELIPLDAPPVDSAMRVALARAFDLSTALDGVAKQARHLHTSAPTPRSVATSDAKRLTPSPTCPNSRLRTGRMSSLPFASRTSAGISSACSHSRLAFKSRVP